MTVLGVLWIFVCLAAPVFVFGLGVLNEFQDFAINNDLKIEAETKEIRCPSDENWCGTNEQWYINRPPCPRTCDNFDQICQNTTLLGSGCDCKFGYSRNKRGGVCVPHRYCLSKYLIVVVVVTK